MGKQYLKIISRSSKFKIKMFLTRGLFIFTCLIIYHQASAKETNTLKIRSGKPQRGISGIHALLNYGRDAGGQGCDCNDTGCPCPEGLDACCRSGFCCGEDYPICCPKVCCPAQNPVCCNGNECCPY